MALWSITVCQNVVHVEYSVSLVLLSVDRLTFLKTSRVWFVG